MDNHKGEKNEYQAQFDDLLGSSNKVSKEEKEFIKRQEQAKKIADQLHEQEVASKAEQYAKKKADEFDDLLSGKKKSNDDKNLQQIFSEFYSKARSTDIKAPASGLLNSAKNSIGSLGSKLEERRNKIKEKTNLDKDLHSEESKTQTKVVSEEPIQKMDQTNQPTEPIQATEEPIKQEAQQETKELPKRVSMKEKVRLYASGVNEKLGVKYPSVHKNINYYYDYVSEVWKETFPNNKEIAKSKIDERKERAKLIKEIEKQTAEMTPEELNAYWESIPEWKRGALVVTNGEKEEEEVQGILKRVRAKIGNKVKETQFAKDFIEKEGENIEWARKEYNAFKGDAREQIENSHNPVIRGTAQVVDKIKSETQWSKAVKEMKKYDPHFDLEELCYEAEEVFKEFYCNYLAGNKEYLQTCSTGPVAVLGAMIDLRKQEGWKYKFEELLDCGQPHFSGAQILDGQPAFTFTIEVQEFDARVDAVNGGPYVWKPKPPKEGEEPQAAPIIQADSNAVMKATYRFTLARHQEPQIELTGHYWEFVEFNKLDEVKQLV